MNGDFDTVSLSSEEGFHTEEYTTHTCVGGVVVATLNQVSYLLNPVTNF